MTDAERADVLRAGIGFVLANDIIGIGRLREKYAAKMAEGPDQRAFEVVTAGLGTNSGEFRDVARVVASFDTLDAFLRELQTRYPDMSVVAPATPGQPLAGAPAPAPRPDRSRPARSRRGTSRIRCRAACRRADGCHSGRREAAIRNP